MIQKIKEQINIKYLKRNLAFFLSGVFCSEMFCCTAIIWLAIAAIIIFAAGYLSVTIDRVLYKFLKAPVCIKAFSVLSALITANLSARNSLYLWQQSHMIKSIASKIHMSNGSLLFVIASVLAVLSLVFLCVLFSVIFTELQKTLAQTVRYTKPRAILKNINSNLFLIISAFAFMALNVRINLKRFISIFVCYLFIVAVFSQITGIVSKLKRIPLIIKIYSLGSTLGICYFARRAFIENLLKSPTLNKALLNTDIDLYAVIRWTSAVLALLACVVVFVLVSLLLNFVAKNLKQVFRSLSRIEMIIYPLISLSLLAFVCFTFMRSDVFWGTDSNYDIIYMSDSPVLVKLNAYMGLYNPENDLRQPLFAVFAAPFVGLGYALSVPLSHFSPAFTPLFMNAVQIIMMVVANLMLAKLLKLDSVGRICFMLLSTVTYTTLLFSIMMEQYIVAYFWLMFVIYTYIQNKEASKISIIAASGSLLTSLTLLPTAYPRSKNSLREFVSCIEKSILGFFVLLLSFGRLDIIFNFSYKATQLSDFAGGQNLAGRFKQYISFVSSCFFAPKAKICYNNFLHISWQLSDDTINSFNFVGLIILAICIISFVVNRKNILSRIAFLWIGFSVLLLCIIGWGSAENAMILYSLYFGWAFLVLIFQLIKWLSEKINFKMLVPIASGIAIILMSRINLWGIKVLLGFAFKYYPF